MYFGKKKFGVNIHTRPKPTGHNTVTSETPGQEQEEPRPMPSPEKSSSKKKLKYLGMVGTKCDYVKSEMKEGNIIIDLEILSAQVCSFVDTRLSQLFCGRKCENL